MHHFIEDFFGLSHGENSSSKRLWKNSNLTTPAWQSSSISTLLLKIVAVALWEKRASQRFQDLVLLPRNGKFFGGLKTFFNLRGSWVPVVHQS
jgi:hypothetical protein